MRGVESVDVQHVAPPVLWAIIVVETRRHEHHVVGEITHNRVGDADHVQVRSGETGESVAGEPQEVERGGCELVDAVRQPVEVSFGIVAQVQEDDEKSADEEERVDTVHTVDDRLEHKLMFDDFPQLRVVGKVQSDVACVAEDDPTHRDRPNAVDAAHRVVADVAAADRFEVRCDRESQKKLLAEACKNRL